jgi:hypothetical protein
LANPGVRREVATVVDRFRRHARRRRIAASLPVAPAFTIFFATKPRRLRHPTRAPHARFDAINAGHHGESTLAQHQRPPARIADRLRSVD